MQEKALMFQSVPCSIFCCAEKNQKPPKFPKAREQLHKWQLSHLKTWPGNMDKQGNDAAGRFGGEAGPGERREGEGKTEAAVLAGMES